MDMSDFQTLVREAPAPAPTAKSKAAGESAPPPASPLANVDRGQGANVDGLHAMALFGEMFGASPASSAAVQTSQSPLTMARAGIHGVLGGLFDWVSDGSGNGAAANSGKPAAPAKTPAPAPSTQPPAPSVSPTNAPGPSRAAPAAAAPTPAAPAGQKPQQEQDQALLDAALKSSQKNLTKQGFFDSVTKEEASSAMKTLLALPPHLQGQAIGKLDPASFGTMLHTVPESQREQFKALVDNTQDPERKLKLWAEYQKSKMGNAAQKDHEKTQDEGHFWSRSDEQKKNKSQNEKRDQVVESAKSEIDTEVSFLIEKAKSGKISSDDLAKYMSKKDAEAQAELKDLTARRGTLEGLPDKERVDYIKQEAEKSLKEEGFLWKTVPEGKAAAAVDTIKSLPPELQGKVIEQMDRGAFDRMLKNVPELKPNDFESLVKNTHDPERKLLLWGKYHKAKARADANKEKEKTADEGHFWNRSAEQKENKRQNERRDEIVKSTASEVDDETGYLRDRVKKGTLSEADVDSLIERKDQEHALEMKYNVNLVNDEGARKDGSKIAWTKAELTEVESGLARMPMSHVKGNKLLKEIRRSGMAQRDGVDKPNIGGDHSDGVIRIYDTGVNGVYRHTGDTRQLADPSVVPAAGTDISPLEETIVHEVGHDIHDQHADAFKKYKAAAGWQEGMSDADLKKKGLSDAEIATIKGGGEVTGKDGQHYEKDPYNKGQYLSYDEGSIPTPANGAAPNPWNVAHGYGNDTWSYARTNYKDHFAEHYQKAVHTPEKLAQDLLDAPKARAASAATARDQQKAALEQLKTRKSPAPTEAELKAAQQKFDDADKKLKDAEHDRDAQRQQFDIMRNDVFHSDAATTAAEDRLKKKGISEDKLKEFRERAGRASTPEQIALIEQGY
jgi:hypothetical protein